MFCDVVVPGSRLDALTYEFDPERFGLAPGDAVEVALRGRKARAVVLALRGRSPVSRVLPVQRVIEPGFISAELLGLLYWVSRYYVAPLGETLGLGLPPGIIGYRPRSGGEKNTKGGRVQSGQEEESNTGSTRAEEPGYGLAVRDGIAQPASGFGVTCLCQSADRFEAVAGFVADRRRAGAVIVLLPEHKLERWSGQLRARFGSDVAGFHAGQSVKEHKQAWQAVRAGGPGIVVGVRSAVFAPVPTLAGVVVLDEHDEVFKEERRPCYNARDVAVSRARVTGCPVLLCSRTPSAETWLNVREGRYGLAGAAEPRPERPGVYVVDRRRHRGDVLTPMLVRELRAGLERGGALLYVNRLGLSRHVVCEECGHVLACDDCRLPLALHADGRAVCGLCGRTTQAPAECPECSSNRFSYQAPGVELVARHARDHVPDARVTALTTDSDGPVDFSAGSVVVGTRALLGREWPATVAMVGVVSFDYELVASEFRSRERAFQRMFEVERRAALLRARLVVQTWRPEESVLRRALEQDAAGFIEHEVNDRRELALPPHSRLGLVVCRGAGERPEADARRIAGLLGRVRGLELLGPVPGPAQAGRRTWRLLLKCARGQRLDRLVERVRPALLAKGTKLDVDPLAV